MSLKRKHTTQTSGNNQMHSMNKKICFNIGEDEFRAYHPILFSIPDCFSTLPPVKVPYECVNEIMEEYRRSIDQNQ